MIGVMREGWAVTVAGYEVTATGEGLVKVLEEGWEMVGQQPGPAG